LQSSVDAIANIAARTAPDSARLEQHAIHG
jgi:hypothetical protein